MQLIKLLPSLLYSIAFIMSIILMVKEREKIPPGQVSQDELTLKQKITIWFICVFNPIVAGAIFYYGWKGKFPMKAKSANSLSWLAFLTFLALLVGYSMLV